MTSDKFDDSPEEQTQYERLWQNPEVPIMLQRHFAEQLQAGIFASYNAGIRHLFVETDIYETDDPEGMAQAIINAELPLAIVADVPEGQESGMLENATLLGLLKVNPANGEALDNSLVNAAEVKDSRAVMLYPGFSGEQVDLLLRQGREQADVGLHPHIIYNAYTQ